jgi:LCP family protein required for cell wall assembly
MMPAVVQPPPPVPQPPIRRRRPSAKRILLGALAVLALSAAAGAVLFLGQIITLRDALSQNPSLVVGEHSLATAGFGDPQTLLLVGDDQRALTKYYHRAVLPHSNEMLLVRIDPSKPWISMLSIPRDLLVTIYPPKQAPITTRFNYAYTAGGIPLLLSTIKRYLGVSVNHVVVITFGRFRRAVDQMGCVYSTIDRRYYHSNANAAATDQYQEINLQPGYQKLCGNEALQFVSYRHGDTALVRDSRDQSFLLDVKRQYGPTLAGNVNKFERIFGEAVQTDPGLHSISGIEDLLGTLVASSGRRVRQVPFQANLLPNAVTATHQQIAASVRSFLYGGSALPTAQTAAVAHAVRSHRNAARLPLAAVPSAGLEPARAQAKSLPFALEYPRVQDRAGSVNPVYLRSYLIHAPNGSAYPIYVSVFGTGSVGQYYDVQGTTWKGAPQFSSPDQTVRVGGRRYNLYYESDTLETVAWYDNGAVYWVRNTLGDALSNGELLAIAEQTRPVTGAVAPVRTGLRAAAVPVRAAAPSTTTTKDTVGAISALLTLLAVPLLGIPLIRRRRELARLRRDLELAIDGEARVRSQADAVGVPDASAAAVRAYVRRRPAARVPAGVE